MKILIPIDGSPCSDAAVAFIAARPPLDAGHPQIDLLNVQSPLAPRAGRAVDADYECAWHAAESDKVLKPAVAMLKQADLDPAWFYRVGHPSSVIAEWAEKNGIDLIVMGSHGRTALKSLLMGSLAQGLLASTTVPMLLLRSPHAPTGPSLRVGIALDGSTCSRVAADYVLEHHAIFGPRPAFTLLHVVEKPRRTSSSRAGTRHAARTTDFQASTSAASRQVIGPVKQRFTDAGLEIEEQCIVGRAGAEIAKFTTDACLDLLVMGSHGHGALTAALLGSVASRVAATCITPLLLIRASI